MKTIHLTHGRVTIVDDEDYDTLTRYKWHLSKKGYAAHSLTGGGTIYLHRLILGNLTNKQICDHINGNPLDNRKTNLRLCTRAENSRNHKPRVDNKTGYNGVSGPYASKKWRAQVHFEGKRLHLGYYSTPEAAAKAYDAAALKCYQEFAALNFPEYA